MVHKSRSDYVCQQCGYESVGWMGKCPECGSWGSLVETVTVVNLKHEARNSKQIQNSKPVSLSSISSKKTARISTKISELDRVLGGGIIAGQVVLLAGEPGIGKSTILLELAEKLGQAIYVAGEESSHQIKVRADRLGVKGKSIEILEETDVDRVIDQLSAMSNQLSVIIVDSIQTMSTSDLSGMAGSVGQVRECAFRLSMLAKRMNIPLFIVGHVTKEGTVAGPAVLIHMVDTVLWFEGDKFSTLRLLRAVKNRFGPTDEVGIFEMKEEGLVGIDDPEKIFVWRESTSARAVSGSVISSILEGTRPILVEVQSLVVPTKLPFPKRSSQGIDQRRLEMLIAILIRRARGLPLYEYDIFVNIAGGIVAKDTGIDLAICLSIVSAFFDKPLSGKLFAVGEVGLLGEIREAVSQERRIKEARRLGLTEIAAQARFKFLTQVLKEYFK